MKNPKISVLMPVYNCSQFLAESIKSILNQTYPDFELVIIDDGSTDQTLKVIQKFKDKRIHLIKNSKNLGVSKSLNIGLRKARGEWIARADGDDICLPNRFKDQISFLTKHPEVILIGSNSFLIDQDGRKIKDEFMPESDLQIRQSIFKSNPFLHPTVMFKKAVALKLGGYNEAYNGAEDYNLWFKLIKNGQAYNIQKSLIKRRIHAGAVTNRKNWLKIELMALTARINHFPIISHIGLDAFAGLFIFLIYRWWLNFQLFYGRMVPPEPDDTYLYLSSAKNLFDIRSFEQFRMLLFSVWLRGISLITGFNLEKSFEINFYIGLLIMFLVLIRFLRKLEPNIFKRLVLICVISLYTGSGAYHGFYWVLPSFYVLASILFLFSFIFESEIKIIRIFILTLFFIFIHPSSILFSLVFLIYSFITLITSRFKINQQSINSGVVFGLSLLSYLVYGFVAKLVPNLGEMSSPSDGLALIEKIIKGNIDLSSWTIINREYFNFIFIHPLVALGFGGCVALIFYQKYYTILKIFLASLIVVFISIPVPFGYRTLNLLWPITFLVIGYGLISYFEIIKLKSFKLALISSLIFLLVFQILTTSFSLIWIRSVNLKNNYNWNRACPTQLISAKKVYFPSWDSLYAFQTWGMSQNIGSIISDTQSLSSGDLFVNGKPLPNPQQKLDPLSDFLARNITRRNPYPNFQIADYYWTSIKGFDISKYHTKTVLDCGHFEVLKIK